MSSSSGSGKSVFSSVGKEFGKSFQLGPLPEVVIFVGVGLAAVFLVLLIFPGFFAFIFSKEVKAGFRILWLLLPLWGPLIFGVLLFRQWTNYVRGKFLLGQKHVLLELRLPREVYKSPAAMELVLSNLYVTSGESTWFDVYFKGKVRTWFSLEIVSIEGNLHFYVWTREGFKTLVEAQFYSQYPDIEIFEVPDYTEGVPYYDPSKLFVVGHEFKLEKADPYPIKTYVDYGLDKDPKEEFKNDPLTPILEYFASLKKGEQVWLQIMFQSHRRKVKHGTWFEKSDVHDEAEEVIRELQKKLEVKTVDEQGQPAFSRIPTKAEAEVMAAVARNAAKLNFDCGMRLVYAATHEAFTGSRIPALIGILRPFSTKDLNAFTYRWGTYFDYPWEDFNHIREDARKRELVKAYRLRSWFHHPFHRPPFILSSEELATVFHLPGTVLQAPSVNRTVSKKAEAPVNLPR